MYSLYFQKVRLNEVDIFRKICRRVVDIVPCLPQAEYSIEQKVVILQL